LQRLIGTRAYTGRRMPGRVDGERLLCSTIHGTRVLLRMLPAMICVHCDLDHLKTTA
jgi:hypothetical protein